MLKVLLTTLRLGLLFLICPESGEGLSAIAGVTLLLPYTPMAVLLGFQAFPVRFIGVLAAIVGLYRFCAEKVKQVFYTHVHT